jgi:DNA-directed RNA polymerase specialized sigma subunit
VSENELTYPDEYVKVVERMLREHPAKIKELADLKEYIISLCSEDVLREAGLCARIGSSPEERIIEAFERNAKYQNLSKSIQVVETALNYLSAAELTLVECIYWRGLSVRKTAKFLHIHFSNVARNRRRIISCLIKDLIPDFL